MQMYDITHTLLPSGAALGIGEEEGTRKQLAGDDDGRSGAREGGGAEGDGYEESQGQSRRPDSGGAASDVR